MHPIKRAVILAAGRGTRLLPLTAVTPKPLLRVKGVPLIESAIEALRENGIQEIHIVVGHLCEAFAPLARRFPQLHLIYNPFYDQANNIASLYCAREHLQNAVIFDGDQLIQNPSVFAPSFARSGYLAVPNTAATPEWTLCVRRGVIQGCTRGGGADPYRLISASLWSGRDGAQLARDVEEVFLGQERRELYWDDVPLFVFPERYRLGIRLISPEDIREIDTIPELLALDPSHMAALA